MKNIFLIILMIILVACDSSKSGGQLAHSNYYLDNSDASHVYVTKKTNGGNLVVIDQMVVASQVDGDYLFALQKIATSYDCYGENQKWTVMTEYTGQSAFWIVDLKKEQEFGPMDMNAFREKTKSLGVVLELNEPTKYLTNEGAAFKEQTAKCTKLKKI